MPSTKIGSLLLVPLLASIGDEDPPMAEFTINMGVASSVNLKSLGFFDSVVLIVAKLLTLEAMKMETMLNAEQDGTVSEVLVKAGSQVETGDLLVVFE